MKKKLFLMFVCLTVLLSYGFSGSKKKMDVELYTENVKAVDFSEMDSEFEFVTLFYQNIFFTFDLLNYVDRDALRDICIDLYNSLKEGYRSQVVVNNFIGNDSLIITFSQMPSDKSSLLIMTNYDNVKKSIIVDPDDMKDSFALLYYLRNGKLIYYKYVDEEQVSAQEKLEQNLKDLKDDPQSITYVKIAENYYEMNEIERGLKYLKDNKKKAIKLSPKTSKPGNINDVILCVEEEGKTLLQFKK